MFSPLVRENVQETERTEGENIRPVTLAIATALGIVAAILAAVELARSRGQALLAWAVLLLAVAVTFSRL